jgi:hypothetical protein
MWFLFLHRATSLAIRNQAIPSPTGGSSSSSLDPLAEDTLLGRDHGGIGLPFTGANPAVSASPVSVMSTTTQTPDTTSAPPESVSSMIVPSLSSPSAPHNVASATAASTRAVVTAVSTVNNGWSIIAVISTANSNPLSLATSSAIHTRHSTATSMEYSTSAAPATSSTAASPSKEAENIDVQAMGTSFSDAVSYTIVSAVSNPVVFR